MAVADPVPEQVDLLVVGGGMAGLTAGWTAATGGARVLVVEKREQTGGSAALSAGIFWAPPDEAALHREVPYGDRSLGHLVVAEYADAVDSLRRLGIDVTDQFDGVMGYGIGHRIDVAGYTTATERAIGSAGGVLVRGRRARRLLTDSGGVVTGAELDGGETVSAAAVLLATGGFQGDPELLTRYLGPASDRLLRRFAPGSVGDGLRLGSAAGGATSSAMGSFYGHLMPHPLPDFAPQHYLPLTGYYSTHCILVNALGRRFCDESRGDYRSTEALLRQPEARGVLICDERTRRERVVTAPYPHGQVVDRFAESVRSGARYLCAPTVDDLVTGVAAWGVPAAVLRTTLDSHAAASRGEPAPVDAPVSPGIAALAEPPFHALEVQPAITFTYGGLRVGEGCAVLDHDGVPVPGLYAAGADAGGLSNEGYAGGLAPAFITGRHAARAALGSGE